MPAENQSFWADLLQAIAASSLFNLAAWGAIGGATSGLIIKVARRDLFRHIAIGSLVSTGLGALTWPFLMWSLKLPLDVMTPAFGGVAGSTAYLGGVLIPGLLEVYLRGMKRGVLPANDGGKPDV
ncbi:hypothetical protein [Cypionkella sp.]|uniref:hypothetical protein n=1 Tax=Cypionkella sp. TaxID=2811411 RepID=UPI0027265262|nr:hypothetical protein [Cypionkella sp.]MDO8983005.1 hypothetical protein [Cypionkella sp.]MDP2047548.1 hypothetical protein [Cypionkella sp.]